MVSKNISYFLFTVNNYQNEIKDKVQSITFFLKNKLIFIKYKFFEYFDLLFKPIKNDLDFEQNYNETINAYDHILKLEEKSTIFKDNKGRMLYYTPFKFNI